jgi:hypothetical protein
MTGYELKTGASTLIRPNNVVPYTAGDAIADLTPNRFGITNIFRMSPASSTGFQTGILKNVRLYVQGVLAVGTFRLWFENAFGPPTVADNVPFPVNFSQANLYFNYVDIELVAGTDCCFGQEFPDIPVQSQNGENQLSCQAQTLFAWVPTANQQFTLIATIDPR